MTTYGPWIQPDDRWGPTFRTDRGVRAFKTGTPQDPDLCPIVEIDIDFPDAQLDYDAEFLNTLAAQSVIEFNPAADAAHYMPRVFPSGPMPTGATGVDYETPAGTVIGDITISSWRYMIANQTGPAGFFSYTDSAYLAELAAVTYQLRRLPLTDLTLGGDGRYHVAGDWLSRSARSGYPVVFTRSSPVPASSADTQTFTGPAITFPAASLEDGKAFLLANVEPPPGQVNFSGVYSSGSLGQWNTAWELQDEFGDGFDMTVFYRPPRYRYVFRDVPTDFPVLARTTVGARLVLPLHLPKAGAVPDGVFDVAVPDPLPGPGLLGNHYTDPIVLAGASGEVTFDITGAGVDDPDENYWADGHTIWFRWVAPVTGTASFDTAATPPPRWDSAVTAYVDAPGLPMSNDRVIDTEDDNYLQPGVTTDDGYGTAQVTFACVAGDVYYVQVDSYDYAAAGTNPSAGYPRSDCVLRWDVT